MKTWQPSYHCLQVLATGTRSWAAPTLPQLLQGRDQSGRPHKTGGHRSNHPLCPSHFSVLPVCRSWALPFAPHRVFPPTPWPGLRGLGWAPVATLPGPWLAALTLSSPSPPCQEGAEAPASHVRVGAANQPAEEAHADVQPGGPQQGGDPAHEPPQPPQPAEPPQPAQRAPQPLPETPAHRGARPGPGAGEVRGRASQPRGVPQGGQWGPGERAGQPEEPPGPGQTGAALAGPALSWELRPDPAGGGRRGDGGDLRGAGPAQAEPAAQPAPPRQDRGQGALLRLQEQVRQPGAESGRSCARRGGSLMGFLVLRQARGVHSRVTTGVPILNGSLFSEVSTLV